MKTKSWSPQANLINVFNTSQAFHYCETTVFTIKVRMFLTA